ncbi:hypothetical protein ABZT49_32875 [Methylobacterium sp. EM32]
MGDVMASPSTAAVEVAVYWHTRRRAWSIRAGNRVVRHVAETALRDVRFVVHHAAVARVQRLQVREVCAFAVGTPIVAPRWPSAIRVRFDPFEAAAFLTDDGVAVLKASLVHFEADGSCYAVL